MIDTFGIEDSELDGDSVFITFDETGSAQVHLRDYISHIFKETDEAVKIQQEYADEIEELHELQVQYEESVFELFSATPFFIDNQSNTVTTDFDSVAQIDDGGDRFSLGNCEILSVDFNMDGAPNSDSEVSVVVDISCIVNNEEQEASFTVQTISGFYMPQMGCLILGENGESYNNVEKILLELYDIPNLSMLYYTAEVRAHEVYHPAGFNASINQTSIYIKEYESKFTVAVVNDDFTLAGYVKPETLASSYDSLEEAIKSLDQYRTGEHHDIAGVNNAVKDLLDQEG